MFTPAKQFAMGQSHHYTIDVVPSLPKLAIQKPVAFSRERFASLQ
jgi:hypothetical protein